MNDHFSDDRDSFDDDAMADLAMRDDRPLRRGSEPVNWQYAAGGLVGCALWLGVMGLACAGAVCGGLGRL